MYYNPLDRLQYIAVHYVTSQIEIDTAESLERLLMYRSDRWVCRLSRENNYIHI